MRYLVLLIAVVLTGIGCRSLPQTDETPPSEDVVSGVGTVRYIELEGGFYGIVGDDERRYLPDALDEALREDGLRIRFRAQLRNDVMTTQMWDRPVQILEVMRLENGG